MRIWHLGKYYPPASGGIETHVQTLARAQVRLGHDVGVLCINHLGADGADVTHVRWARTLDVEEMDEGVRVWRLGRRASLARFDLCPNLLGALARIEHERPDILHLHAPNPAFLFGLLARVSPAALVVTHHSDVVRQKVLGRAFRVFEQLIYARAARVLASSEPYIDGSVLLNRFREKVSVLPLGLELEPLLAPSAAARQFEGRLRAEAVGPLWLCVGRLVYYKGIATALRALPHVPGRLMVVGSGPDEEKLRGLAHSLGLEGRVTWAGHLTPEELVGAYHAAQALWFPSCERSEGFGLVQVEAMAAGCPVINTALRHSGVPWVSLHDETGLTVPVGDAEALARAAHRLLDEPGLRERLGEAARRRATTEFEANLMALRCTAIYVAGGGGAERPENAGFPMRARS